VNPIVAVENGDEALAYLDGTALHRPSEVSAAALMLLDLNSRVARPRGAGLGAAALRYQRLPIIVLTSSRDEDDINRGLRPRRQFLLVKPVAFDDLLRLVRSLEGYWLSLNVRPDVSAA